MLLIANFAFFGLIFFMLIINFVQSDYSVLILVIVEAITKNNNSPKSINLKPNSL